jgi:hypothetical protein
MFREINHPNIKITNSRLIFVCKPRMFEIQKANFCLFCSDDLFNVKNIDHLKNQIIEFSRFDDHVTLQDV